MAERPKRGSTNGNLGRGGERLAASWLEAHGLRVVAHNWRCPYGEIDVVAEDGDEVVFVEVKTRRGTAYGLPEEAITPRKQRHVIAAALSYMAELPPPERPFRIDVVAVQLAPSGTVLAVRHYPGAVTSEE